MSGTSSQLKQPSHPLTSTTTATTATDTAQSYFSLYEEIELIHKNAASSIFLVVTRKAPKQFFVAKKTPIFSLEEEAQNEIFNECKVLKSLDHPHIIKYNNIYLESEELVVVLEYCEEGDLAHYLKKRIERKDYLSQKLILSWVLQLLMALEYCHSNKIIHRGLSLSNILLTAKGNLKLGSFGHSKVLESTNAMASTSIGKPGYMSPEMFQSKPYDSKSDMWALGCIIYELATFTPLFDDRLPVTSLFDRIVTQSPPDLPPPYMKTLFKIYKYLQTLFRKLLKKNPSVRASASELLKTKLFLNLMEDYLNKRRIDSLDLQNIPLKKLAIHSKLNEAKKKERLTVLPPLIKHSTLGKSKPTGFNQEQDIQLSSTMERSVESQSTHSMLSSSSRSSLSDKSKPKELPNSSFNKTKKQRSNEDESQPKQSEKVQQHRICLPSIDNRNSPRLTNKNEEEQQSNIERLYRLQIEIICKELELKYGPKMDQILERTLEYDPQDF